MENKSTKGGLLVGATDKDGGKGIQVLAPEGSIVMGGAEIIINEKSATKHCELLSKINSEDGNGVEIPCDIQPIANTTDSKLTEGEVIKKLIGGKVGHNTYAVIDDTYYNWLYNGTTLYALYMQPQYECELECLINHPEFFKAYEKAGRIKVTLKNGKNSSAKIEFPETEDLRTNIDQVKITITLNFDYHHEHGTEQESIDGQNPEDSKEAVMLHELQHLLQKAHHRSHGTTTSAASRKADVRLAYLEDKARKGIARVEELSELEDYKRFSTQQLRDLFYYSNPGEIEARKVVRKWLAGKEIRYIDPLTQDFGIDIDPMYTGGSLSKVIHHKDKYKGHIFIYNGKSVTVEKLENGIIYSTDGRKFDLQELMNDGVLFYETHEEMIEITYGKQQVYDYAKLLKFQNNKKAMKAAKGLKLKTGRVEGGFGVRGLSDSAVPGKFYHTLFTGAETIDQAVELGKKMFKADDRVSLVEITSRKKDLLFGTITQNKDKTFNVKVDENGELKTSRSFVDKKMNKGGITNITNMNRGNTIGITKEGTEKYRGITYHIYHKVKVGYYVHGNDYESSQILVGQFPPRDTYDETKKRANQEIDMYLDASENLSKGGKLSGPEYNFMMTKVANSDVDVLYNRDKKSYKKLYYNDQSLPSGRMLSYYIEKQTGRKTYFDNVDLVDEKSSKTILGNALGGKYDFSDIVKAANKKKMYEGGKTKDKLLFNINETIEDYERFLKESLEGYNKEPENISDPRPYFNKKIQKLKDTKIGDTHTTHTAAPGYGTMTYEITRVDKNGDVYGKHIKGQFETYEPYETMNKGGKLSDNEIYDLMSVVNDKLSPQEIDYYSQYHEKINLSKKLTSVEKKDLLEELGKTNKMMIGGKLSGEEKQFIREESQNSGQGFTYRTKVLFGQQVVLKEKNGSPIKKWTVDDYETGKKISDQLNKANMKKMNQGGTVSPSEVKPGMIGEDYNDEKGTVIDIVKVSDYFAIKQYDTTGWLYEGFKEEYQLNDNDYLVAVREKSGRTNVYVYGEGGFNVYRNMKKEDGGQLKRYQFVKDENGRVGEIINISSDKEIADVKWNDGKSSSIPTNKLRPMKKETGLYVVGRTQMDNNKIQEFVDNSYYYAEFNVRENYWLFPEEEENYDSLEKELDKEFAKRDINARFEGIFNQGGKLKNNNIKKYNEGTQLRELSADYWEEYSEVDSKSTTDQANVGKIIQSAIDEWNESADEQLVGESKSVNRAANNFFDDKGYINVGVVLAMITQLGDDFKTLEPKSCLCKETLGSKIIDTNTIVTDKSTGISSQVVSTTSEGLNLKPISSIIPTEQFFINYNILRDKFENGEITISGYENTPVDHQVLYLTTKLMTNEEAERAAKGKMVKRKKRMFTGGSVDRVVEDAFFKWDEIFEDEREGIITYHGNGKRKIAIDFEGKSKEDIHKFMSWLQSQPGVEVEMWNPTKYTITVNESMNKGGGIPNNYKGKTPAQIWESWDNEQVMHFISDHEHELGSLNKGQMQMFTDMHYEDLPGNVKLVFKDHVSEGQYSKGGKTKLCDKGTEIQTVIFKKDKFSKSEANEWLDYHNLKSSKVDEKTNSWRFRQEKPSDFRKNSLKSKKIKEGVTIVIGCKKSK